MRRKGLLVTRDHYIFMFLNQNKQYSKPPASHSMAICWGKSPYLALTLALYMVGTSNKSVPVAWPLSHEGIMFLLDVVALAFLSVQLVTCAATSKNLTWVDDSDHAS